MPNIEITSTSWFARLKNAVFGVVLGVILIIGASVLLFWNETRAVKTYQSLVEGKASVVAAQTETVDGALEGKLIHLQGAITTDTDPEDTASGVWAEGAVALKRSVQMYQWAETQSSKTEKKLGGGEETVTTYTYAMGWYDAAQNSTEFYNPEGHQNPAMAVTSEEFTVPEAALGAYVIAGDRLAPLGTSQPIEFTPEDAAAIGESLGLTRAASLVDGAIFAGTDPQKPEIGDMKVTYARVDLAEASFVAQQVGDGLQEFATSNGYTVFLSASGLVSSDKLFADAQEANVIITWLLRAIGLVLMFVGFAASLKILSVIGDVIPFVGTAIGFGTGIFSLLATLCLGPLIIAIGWFAARPLLSVAILAIAGLAVFGIARMKKMQAVV